MERLTVGTHQGHCISQAGASLLQAKTILPPNCLTTRFHAIVNVVNKQEKLHNERITPGTQQLAQLFFSFREGAQLHVVWGMWLV